MIKEWTLIIKRKSTGHYTIEVFIGSKCITTMGAAKSSPVGQCIKLLERLIDLSKKVQGYE